MMIIFVIIVSIVITSVFCVIGIVKAIIRVSVVVRNDRATCVASWGVTHTVTLVACVVWIEVMSV